MDFDLNFSWYGNMKISKEINKLPKVLLERLKHIHSEDFIETISFEHITEKIIDYYENIIGCMPGNVYWFDKNCIAIGCSKNVLDMFGFKHLSEFKGLTFEDMGKMANWTPAATQSFKRDSLEVIATGKAKLNIEEPPIPDSNGKMIYFLSNRVPLFDSENKVVGMVGISFDITERKQLEEALLKARAAEVANKAKNEFLMNMRHDIRTPLTGIIGFANLIKEEANHQRISEYADNMLASSLALLDFLNEVLDVIQFTSGEIPHLKKKFDLKAKLQSVVTLNQTKAVQKKVALLLECDDKLPNYLIGDFKRIHRIVLELVSNALNFTHEGEIKISVSLAKKQDYDIIIKIVVSDTGIGIPNDKLDEIYLPFKKLNPSYEGIYKGIGIGLTIVKQFIDDLDGEIYVNSEVNKGSTFTCIVRLKEALIDEAFGVDNTTETSLVNSKININNQSITPQLGAFEQSEPSAVRVLLVEDQTIAAAAAKALLSKLNCQIDLAKDGKSALLQAKTQDYDLIFMDVGLPDTTGNEVTREIRVWEISSDKHIPIVGLTAHVDTEEKQVCIEAGMDAVLTKPLLKETAIDILTAFIPKYAEKLLPPKSPLSLAEEATETLPTINEKAIDLDLATKVVGDFELAKEMLKLLIEAIPEEHKNLNKAYNDKNWKEIQAIAHKLKGSSSYCGAVRLNEASSHLQNYLKAEKIRFRDALYKQVLDEMDLVSTEFQALKLN